MILVAVDGSNDATRALLWAATTATVTGARVVAVHAVGLLEHERGDPEGHHLEGRLAVWTSPLDALGADRVERRLEVGDPVSVLLRMVDQLHPEMVVVGTRGAGARHGTALGSTSLALAQRCPVPLVIVPGTSQPAT